MKRLSLFALLTIVCVVTGFAQKFAYQADFNQFLDNREYSTGYEIPQTMLGARLNLMAGARLDTTQGFMAGVNYLYEYGDKIDGNTPTVDLFYYYQKPGTTLLFGSFPRRGLLEYPLALLSDTLDNYRPNIQGAFMEKRGAWGYENAWCDWTGRQRETVKESFMAGFSGKLNLSSVLSLYHYFYMYHKALYAGHQDNDYIRDNGAYAILTGADLTKLTNLDLLVFKLGGMGCYNRQRPSPNIDFYFGLFSQAHIYYKRFGLDALYYRGEKLNIAYGDGLYGSGNYGRFDLVYLPLKTKYVDSRVALCFHNVNGKWQNSQMLSLVFKVGEIVKTYHDHLDR
jgi:hypothetical protein